jgi:glutathione S-transferase
MRLIGNYLSPYVRRVAVSMNVLGVPFELEEVYVFKTPETVRAHNPLVRIPTLIMDDGEVLIESSAILDALDLLVGPARALTPAAGEPRRRVLKVTAIAVGAMEKAQWAFYEGRFRPPEKVHQPWIDHNEAQALGALRHLDGLAAGSGGPLAGTEAMSQADISAAVAFAFVRKVRPGLEAEKLAPHLARLTERCEAMAAFAAAPVPA